MLGEVARKKVQQEGGLFIVGSFMGGLSRLMIVSWTIAQLNLFSRPLLVIRLQLDRGERTDAGDGIYAVL